MVVVLVWRVVVLVVVVVVLVFVVLVVEYTAKSVRFDELVQFWQSVVNTSVTTAIARSVVFVEFERFWCSTRMDVMINSVTLVLLVTL